MPKKLTLAQVAKLARAKDAAAWDAMTTAQRQKMVADLNAAAHPEADPTVRDEAAKAKVIAMVESSRWKR